MATTQTLRPLTDVDRLAALFILLGGDSIRVGQTGIRVTLSPIPVEHPDAHKKCHSVDLTDAGLANLVAKLSQAAAPAGTEAA